jgi:hypothetical protein
MVDADDLTCADCGLLVALGREDRYLHTEEPPEKWEPHDVTDVTTRRAFLFGHVASVSAATADSPGERSARALERIADAAERIAARMDN